MFSKSKKLISMLIIFVIVFTYMGQTLEAVATTDGLSAITNGFFSTKQMELNSYFEKDGSQDTQNISNVNEKATLILELSPTDIGKGFLKEGIISATGADGSDANFRFSKIKEITVDEPEEAVEHEIIKNEENRNVIEDETNQEENEENINIIEDEMKQEDIVEDEKTVTDNTIENNVTNENINSEENVNFEEVEVENITDNNTTELEEVEENQITSRSSETREENENEAIPEEDQLVNEEEVIQEVLAEEEEEDKLGKYQVDILSDNEIKVQTITARTKIAVEIEYIQKENLDLSDLYKEINLNLSGTFINVNIEEVEQNLTQNINVGWSYSKEIEASSSYTKFSPYQVGEKQGSILENKIVVKRETEDEKYLPIKNTNIEITVPTLNGERPTSVSVGANKLMATKGQDTGNVEFTIDNWNYNEEDGKVYISVANENNGTAVNSLGTDEYVVVYKYANFVEEGNYNFETNAIVTVEEYSANENNQVQKEISGSQAIDAVIGEMISYNINTNEEPVNKGKINANYNSEVALYETEFSTTVNLNILTSDMFEELRIDSSKENYLDGKGTAFEATDIYYKKVKFSYNEIKDILANGGSIEILNYNNELLYALNSELITKQEDCEINLESQPTGIFVVLKNVTVNQNLSIEFTKAIQKSNYDKATFNTFRKIESRVSASVKYANEDTTYALSEIAVEKEMKSSMTVANISLNNNNLTTLNENQNVEMRIELNNDKDTSDLYTNPSFEVVFPKYVKNVTVQNINVTYSGGLRIEDFQTYTENDIVKMRINLSGTQNMFSESTITHGTNILVTANITLDDYTPSKKDQIKMYYSNEAVTNYESQTKWTISKEITPGILRETNGFDVEVINFQAPNGLVTANSIVNYDGNLSTVKSIRQGEKVAKINMDSPARITTMELFVSNNTGNTCNNIVLLGRVPFKDNTNVITNENMGTTVDTSMMAGIKEDVTNLNLTTIYYSSNPNANADLSDENNGWTTNVINWQNIKSYMIVVKGSLEAGSVLRYSYDFEIPANLDYSSAIYGSFGAYYNNYSETAIADKVGIVTEKEPEYKISVYPYGENTNLYYGQIVTLVAKVQNNSEEALENADLNVSVPTGTIYTEIDYYEMEDQAGLNQRYIDDESISMKRFNIEHLEPGETKMFSFEVKVLDNIEESSNLNGYVQLNDEVQNYSFTATKGKMIVMSELIPSDTICREGTKVLYYVYIDKKTDENLNNLRIKFSLPDYLQLNEINLFENGKCSELNYDTQKKEIVVDAGNLNQNEKMIEVVCTINNLNVDQVLTQNIFDVYEDTNPNNLYSSNVLSFTAQKMFIDVRQEISSTTLSYDDTFEYTITVKNKSTISDYIRVTSDLPTYLYLQNVKVVINNEEKNIDAYNYLSYYDTLPANGTLQITATGKVKDLEYENKELDLSNIVKVTLNKQEEVKSNEIKVKILPIEESEEDDEEEENEEETYSISGTTWIDNNGDGIKDVDDTDGIKAEVQLLKNGNVLQATTTNEDGSYSFKDLTQGDYTVVTKYDEDIYEATSYTSSIENHAYETEKGKSVTDNITITDSNVKNLDIGLVEKEKFDFQITQTINKAVVNTDGRETEYRYDDLELAKLEMQSKDLTSSNVKFVYKIRVENVGNVDGKVSSIVDYLPNGMRFIESENPFWAMGVDGKIYYSGLKDTTIKAGDFQDVSLVLEKKMTEDSTKVLSNKAEIAYTESATRAVEAKTNNLASQETIVTTAQGMNGKVITGIAISWIAIIGVFGYMLKKEIIVINWNGGIKKVYR